MQRADLRVEVDCSVERGCLYRKRLEHTIPLEREVAREAHARLATDESERARANGLAARIHRDVTPEECTCELVERAKIDLHACAFEVSDAQ